MFKITSFVTKKKCGGVIVGNFAPQNGGEGFKSSCLHPICFLGS
jgi:hypothetical protein